MKLVNIKTRKVCYIYEGKVQNNYLKDEKYRKVRNHSLYTWEYRGPLQIICDLKYSVPKKILIIFHNGYNYDYHFIIEKWAANFKK